MLTFRLTLQYLRDNNIVYNKSIIAALINVALMPYNLLPSIKSRLERRSAV